MSNALSFLVFWAAIFFPAVLVGWLTAPTHYVVFTLGIGFFWLINAVENKGGK